MVGLEKTGVEVGLNTDVSTRTTVTQAASDGDNELLTVDRAEPQDDALKIVW